MRFHATLAVLGFSALACAHNESGTSDAGPSSRSDAVCEYRGDGPSAWSIAFAPELGPSCSANVEHAECDIDKVDPKQRSISLSCAAWPAHRVTLMLRELPEGLAVSKPGDLHVDYWPDRRGDNGRCQLTAGRLTIRDRDDALVLGLADLNITDTDLTKTFAPVTIHARADDCAEEVVNTCAQDWKDTRQALVVTFKTGSETLALRAGDQDRVGAVNVRLDDAIKDTGHPCCYDCGSGASKLSFVLTPERRHGSSQLRTP